VKKNCVVIAHRTQPTALIAAKTLRAGATTRPAPSKRGETLNIIYDASATLRKFLDARFRGASEEELKALQAADEAARTSFAERGARPRLTLIISDQAESRPNGQG
jgi:hypothetical protein